MNEREVNPPNAPKCPQCGRALPANAPAGLCPACLLEQGANDSATGGAPIPFEPPSIAELAPLFPQLEILELIGKGGMGAVYKARQRELDRLVALKILPPGIGNDPAFAERFTREAKALAKLNHPGIVTIYEFGRADGLFFFFMEFIDGVTLRQLLNTGRVSPREALAIVPQICDALQFAHDQGIVHRDIKAENILLDRRGRVKVADFGVAKIVGNESLTPPLSPSEGERMAQPGEGSAVLTEPGKIMGTPNYMAPEQMEHPTEVDHRADIYALGVVFYQMLTGELPGKKLEAPSKKVQIDVRLDEVVLRALEKKPELRYQQASVFKTQVETIAMTPDGGAQAESSKTSDDRVRRLQRMKAIFFWFTAACSLVSAVLFFDKGKSLPGILWVIGCLGFIVAGFRRWPRNSEETTVSKPLESKGKAPLLADFINFHSRAAAIVFALSGFAGLGALSIIPGWERFAGFFGFFGLIGVAVMIELIHRKKHRTNEPQGMARVDEPHSDRFLRFLVWGIYGVAIFIGIWPVIGLIADPRDPHHLPRFGFCWIVALGVAIIGKLLSLLAVFLSKRAGARSENSEASKIAESGSHPRRWRWLAWIAGSIIFVALVRTFLLEPFYISGSSVEPELPTGSRVLVWKLGDHFAPGDILAYHHGDQVWVGRVSSSGASGVVINRNEQPDQTLSKDLIIGKVISVFWRASGKILAGSSEPVAPWQEVKRLNQGMGLGRFGQGRAGDDAFSYEVFFDADSVTLTVSYFEKEASDYFVIINEKETSTRPLEAGIIERQPVTTGGKIMRQKVMMSRGEFEQIRAFTLLSRPHATNMSVVTEGQKATITARLEKDQEFMVFVGRPESPGWTTRHGFSLDPAASKTQTIIETVEALDRVRLQDGSYGKGFGIGSAQSMMHVAIIPDGPVPYGELIFRKNSDITETNGVFTFADIRKADGTLVPISARVRPIPPGASFGPVVELPDKSTVRLVALYMTQSGTNTWWLPNGRPIAANWEEKNMIKTRSKTSVEGGGGWRVVQAVVAVAGDNPPPELLDEYMTFEGMEGRVKWNANRDFQLEAKGRDLAGWTGYSKMFPDDVTIANMAFTVAAGPFQSESAGEVTHFDEHSMVGVLCGKKFNIGKLTKRQRNAAITLSLLYEADGLPMYRWRLRVDTTDGRTKVGHIVEGQSGPSLLSEVWEFDGIPPEQVKAVHFELRPIYRVEFRNVALHPKMETQVEVLSGVEVAPSPSAAVQNGTILTFGPVIERTVEGVIDFDTGKTLAELPKEVTKANDIAQNVLDVVAWMEREGMDAIVDTTRSFKGVGMVAVGAPNALWDQTPGDVEATLGTNQPSRLMSLLPDGKLSGTWAFKTREGSKGLLQITGFTENPSRVILRYKLVQTGLSATPQATTTALPKQPNAIRRLEDLPTSAQVRVVEIFSQYQECHNEFGSAISARNLEAARAVLRRMRPFFTEYNEVARGTDSTLPPEVFAGLDEFQQALDAGDWNRFQNAHANEVLAREYERIKTRIEDLARKIGNKVQPVKGTNDSFGPVIERVINEPMSGWNTFLDFDNGELMAQPEGLISAEDAKDLGGRGDALLKVLHWTQQSGADAMFKDSRTDAIGLRCFDTKMVPTNNAAWDQMTPLQVTEALSSIPHMVENLMYPWGNFPMTSLFKTRQGHVGILQLMGYTENPRGMKVRYKLLLTSTSVNKIDMSPPMRFGQVYEKVITEFNNRVGYEGLNLFNCSAFAQPRDMDHWTEEGLEKWIIENNIDLMVDHGPGGRWAFMALRTNTQIQSSLVLSAIKAEKWDSISTQEFVDELNRGPGNLEILDHGVFRHMVLPASNNLPWTCAFKTAQKAWGLLQVIDFTKNPSGVRIRYKLVQPATNIGKLDRSVSLQEAKARLADLMSRYGERHALVQEAQARVKALEQGDASMSIIPTALTNSPNHIGIFLVVSNASGLPTAKTPLSDFTLASEPAIRESDILSYEWDSHTITVKSQEIADRILKHKGTGGLFVVVVDGQRIYWGQMQSVLSSWIADAPVIHIGATADQYSPKFKVRICAPPNYIPDTRGDERLKAALRTLKLLH
jgi:serine/threonine protein kinase/signal peptidase I